jgi:hypothetical protein
MCIIVYIFVYICPIKQSNKMKGQVKINYASGWKITIPKHGMAPMLFLEWISNSQQHFNLNKPVGFKIKTIANPDDVLSDNFEIRLDAAIAEIHQDCFQYINGNL